MCWWKNNEPYTLDFSSQSRFEFLSSFSNLSFAELCHWMVNPILYLKYFQWLFSVWTRWLFRISKCPSREDVCLKTDFWLLLQRYCSAKSWYKVGFPPEAFLSLISPSNRITWQDSFHCPCLVIPILICILHFTIPHHLPHHPLSLNTQGYSVHCFQYHCTKWLILVCLPTSLRCYRDTTARYKRSHHTYYTDIHICKHRICKCNTHDRTSAEWRNWKHQDSAPPWRQKQSKGLLWGLQKPVRSIQCTQAGTNEEEPHGKGKECLGQLPIVTAHCPWHSMATRWEKSSVCWGEKQMYDQWSGFLVVLKSLLLSLIPEEWEHPLDTLWWLLRKKLYICSNIGETTELNTNREKKISRALKSNYTS